MGRQIIFNTYAKKVLGWLPALFLSSCFFFSSPDETPVVHLLDTGFCLEAMENTPSSAKLIGPHNHSGVSTQKNCRKNLASRRYHGNRVLQEIVSHLDSKETIEIHLHVVFDGEGLQRARYWKKALKSIEKSRSHLVAAAIGLPFVGEGPQLNFPRAPFVVASGNVGKNIRRESKLWPQEMAPRENLYLVGSFIPGPRGKRPDRTLLYASKVDLRFAGERKGSSLEGSSLSLATAIGQILRQCREVLLQKAPLGNCSVLE